MIDFLLFAFLWQTAQQQAIRESGRLVSLTETPAERIANKPAISPGAPPVLSFRYYEGRDRHRFGQLDLVLDDAGH